METEAHQNSIKETDYLLLIDNRGNRIIANPKKDKTTSIRKKKVKLANIIGFAYTSTFDVEKNGDVKLVTTKEAEEAFEEEVAEVDEEGVPKVEGEIEEEEEDKNDNRNMVDNNKAQKLQFSDIEKMKQEGVQGQQIIDKLIENSESFSKRTEFSKEKYLAKKRQKHLCQFKVYKTCLDNLAETYFLKSPQYILNFRYDSLALFLHHSYLYPSSRVLMFDNTHGLILAGVRERLGTEGEIHVCSPRAQKQEFKEFKIVTELGFTKEDNAHIRFTTIGEIEANPSQQFSHLLVASEANPTEIIAATLKYIQGGAPIVIFSSYIEPLAECFEYLKANNAGINLRINEIFSREMQVLPDRTHPHMMMQAFSGFVLSGNRSLN